METVFKVEDRAYDALIKQWGTIVRIDNNILYPNPICVDFSNGVIITYTLDGRRHESFIPTLSFTEYDFVNGGFSQVRPKHEIKKDQLVYVRIRGEREWYMRYFSHFDKNGKMHFFLGQQKSTETEYTGKATEYLLENPLTSNHL